MILPCKRILTPAIRLAGWVCFDSLYALGLECSMVLIRSCPGDPDEVAKAVLFLASDDCGWVQGVNLPVDGGYLIM